MIYSGVSLMALTLKLDLIGVRVSLLGGETDESIFSGDESMS
jgi:hypothetical protein